MNLTDLLAALTAHNYLAVTLIALAYLRVLFSPGSKFPVTLTANEQNLVLVALGGAYGTVTAVAGGLAFGSALLHVVVAGGFAGLADAALALFVADPTTAPGWAKALVFLADEELGSAGGTGGSNSAGKVTSLRPASPPPPPPAVARRAKLLSIPPMAFAIGALALVCLLSGCLSVAPIVPVTSANSAQVASCQSTGKIHNAEVETGIGLAGVSAGTASVAAVLPSTDKTAQAVFAIVAAGAAALAGVDTGLSEVSAASFANGQCSSIVGPLPSAAKPDAGPTVSFEFPAVYQPGWTLARNAGPASAVSR